MENLSRHINDDLLDGAMALVAVAETNNFAAAGKLIHINPSAVKRRIERLSDKTNRPTLFTTSGRGVVTLTPAGEQVLVTAKRMVDDARTLRDNIVRLRFSAFPRLTARSAPVIGLFQRRPENHDVRVWYHDVSDKQRRDGGRGLVQRASSGELDVVIARSGFTGTVDSSLAYDWRLRVVLPDGEIRREPITLEELLGYKLICAPWGHASRQLLEEAASTTMGVDFRPVMEMVDQNVARGIARHGKGLAAVLPSDAFGDVPEVDRASEIGPWIMLPDGSPITSSYSIYWCTRSKDTDEDRRRLKLRTKLATSLRYELRKFNDNGE